MTLQELIDYNELEKSDYYQQFLHPSGVYHIMGVDNKDGEHVLSRLRVCRSIEQSPFNAEEKRLCEKLAPHIARALKINSRILKMESERAIYANTVDQLSMGTILLDAQGKILQANAIATQLIQQKDVIKDHDGALQVGTREENNKFRKLLKESIAANTSQQPSAVRAMRVERPATGYCLGLLIRPVPSSEWSVDGESFPSVAVFISDAENRAEAPRQLVGQLFDLTPAEAILATLIAKGLAIDEAAEQLHISRNTARAQLRSIFSKAGVTRQADLVRLILNSVATLG
jgi:DNA-binding CsgD family transcriptional regulator